jgi:hypothetical protein
MEAVFSVWSVPRICHYEVVLRRQLEEEVGVRWPSVCRDVGLLAEERPVLEDVTKQRSEDRD